MELEVKVFNLALSNKWRVYAFGVLGINTRSLLAFGYVDQEWFIDILWARFGTYKLDE